MSKLTSRVGRARMRRTNATRAISAAIEALPRESADAGIACAKFAQDGAPMLFALTIYGRPIVKKNTQRTYGRGRATRRVSTPRYRQWESDAIAACNRAFNGALIEGLLFARYRFYFDNHMAEADVSNLCEAPGDLLQKAGVIRDDRQIMDMRATKHFGQRARTEIELYAFEEGA